MASATVNANLMEALMTHGESHSVKVYPRPQERFGSSPILNPTSRTTPQQHPPLPSNPFDSDQFQGESESQDNNSTSEGDATTEDEDNFEYFTRKTFQSSLSSSKKRRKQIKPIRVSSFEDKNDNQKPSESTDQSFFPEMPNALPEGDYEVPRCPHCHLQTGSEDELRHHIIEDHLGRMLTEEGLRNSYFRSLRRREEARQLEEHFPYHEREEGEMIPLNLSRWDSRQSRESQENRSGSPETGVSLPASLHISPPYGLQSLIPLAPPPFLLPFLQQQQSQQERERQHPAQQPLRPVSNGQPQIFNIEAYCDLCNKEFCNKYFLKTHKANKHGIYSPDICSSQMNSLPNPLGVTPCAPSSIAPTSVLSTPLTVSSLQSSPLSSIPIPGSPFAGAFIAANMSNLPLRPLLPPHLQGVQKSPISVVKNELGASHSKCSVINIEAYCEICQKEFCNKYFLKRHKSKIHNIDIEVTIKSSAKSPLPLGKPYDRPDGWCDACKKDIGSRNLLNSHKLNIHGPHIIVPMTSPKDSATSLETSRESFKETKTTQPEAVNTNFSPWDTKRDEKRDDYNEDNKSTETSSYYKEEKRQRSSPRDEGMAFEMEKEQKDFWDEKETRSRWKDDEYDSHNENSPGEKHVIHSSPQIKEEPIQYGEDQSKGTQSSSSDLEKGETSTHKRPSISSDNEDEKYSEKPELERDEVRGTQTPFRDSLSEQPRTPGAGSSTDENSREQGLIARVGKPAILQAAQRGTKFTPEQLRQLGVINPDAFCELCCKEFCNKYFLRTHRIKKHGIYTPEYSDRSKSKEHSPISLARILERQALEMRSGLSEFNSETECDVCHRSFPSPYLLQMHKYYIHGPGQEILQKEQLYQLQQHPLRQEHIRQLALHVQNKLVPQSIKKDQKIGSSEAVTKTEGQDDHSSLTGLRNIDIASKVPLSRPSSETGSSYQTQLSPSHDGFNRNVFRPDSPQEPDTSEDLRKLQSMILELNRQGDCSSRCKMCQKDVGNKYFMRAHLMTEHGILPPQNDSTILPTESQTPRTSREGTPISSPSSTPVSDNLGYCSICKKDFFNRIILQQHQLSSHGVFTPTSFIERIRAELESRDDRKISNASRSYCEICNKELCNKYFMKTHMMKMHGINVENGTSGGVTCDICRKELCSKYFLKVHKQNSHGLVEDLENEPHCDDKEIQVCPLCSRRFKNIKWLQTHLNSDHREEGKEKWKEMERNVLGCDNTLPKFHVCNICGKQLADLVALQVHFIKNHGTVSPEHYVGESAAFLLKPDEQGVENLKCSFCHISLASSALVHEHEKTHIPTGHPIDRAFLPPPSQVFQCSLCSFAVPTLELYQQHLIHHQLQGILNPFIKKDEFPVRGSEKGPEKIPKMQSDNSGRTPKKCWRCYECGEKFKNRNQCLIHVQIKHSNKITRICSGRSPCRRRLYRCKKCGAVAKSHGTLKRHFRKKHPSILGVPTSHARPSRTDGEFVMQPFLLNKDGVDPNINDEQPFVPSLVYLPVARKVQRPLTVSFCLTPA